VTECPYCGQRVRKRAPKLERPGPRREPRGPARARPAAPRLSRLRPGEIPGVRGDHTGRPLATIVLVAAAFAVYLLSAGNLIDPFDLVLQGPFGDEPSWRVLTAPFVHLGGGGSVLAGGAFEFATMIGVGLYGWLLERRHGPGVVIALFLLAGAGGMAVAALLAPDEVAFGAHGVALGLLCAWAVPDLLAWRRDEDYEGDLLGTGVIAAVLLLMPLAVTGASGIAGVVGAVAGLLVGVPLHRVSTRRA
jgi:membrane associated rhomboid family serine protease